MPAFIDQKGKRFGSWVVLRKTTGRRSYWVCRCDCGNVCDVATGSLNNGTSQRCRKCAGKIVGAKLALHESPEVVRWKKHFANQRWQAAQRGIDFLLTWKEWFRIWTESGHLDERGPRSDEYVMARFGDKGAYEIGNVKIITAAENLSECHSGKTISAKQRNQISLRHRGSGSSNALITEEIVREMRLAFIPHSKTVGAWALARKYGLNKATVEAIVNGDSWRHVLPKKGGKAKDKLAASIRSKYRNGISVQDLVGEYDMSIATIYNVLRANHW